MPPRPQLEELHTRLSLAALTETLDAADVDELRGTCVGLGELFVRFAEAFAARAEQEGDGEFARAWEKMYVEALRANSAVVAVLALVFLSLNNSPMLEPLIGAWFDEVVWFVPDWRLALASLYLWPQLRAEIWTGPETSAPGG